MILWLDPFSGISGDMFLGALVDAGLPFEALAGGLAASGLPGFRLECRRTRRGPLTATKVDVLLDVLGGHSEEPHGGGAEGSAGPAGGHGTTLGAITARIRASGLPEAVKGVALRIFDVLGEAEARIHGVPRDDVHFHEVGAADALADICGAALGAHLLGIGSVCSGPVALGGGTVRCRHGTLPVPGPATAEILRGAPVRIGGVEAELTTPTGAAILRGLGAEFAAPPPGILRAVGYGAGTADRPEPPNVLRIGLLEPCSGAAPAGCDAVAVLEAEMDDITGEALAFGLRAIEAEGPLDWYLTPVQMKKGRPGHLLTVLCRTEDRPRMEEAILRSTTTLGVRHHEALRRILPRRVEEFGSPLGPVRVKIADLGDGRRRASVEFEDAARLAREHGLPLADVERRILEAFEKTCPPGA